MCGENTNVGYAGMKCFENAPRNENKCYEYFGFMPLVIYYISSQEWNKISYRNIYDLLENASLCGNRSGWKWVGWNCKKAQFSWYFPTGTVAVRYRTMILPPPTPPTLNLKPSTTNDMNIKFMHTLSFTAH